MHSAGFELTKLTYTRLKDNLIRHRGDLYAPRYIKYALNVNLLPTAYDTTRVLLNDPLVLGYTL